MGVEAHEKATGDRLLAKTSIIINRAAGKVIDLKLEAWKSSERQLTFRYDLAATNDVPVTMIIAGFSLEKTFAKGKLVLSHADGTESSLNLPFARGAQPLTRQAIFHLDKVGDLALNFDPPCALGFDGDMRIMLASEVFKAGSRTTTVTMYT